MSRMLAPAVLAVAIGLASLSPSPVRAQGGNDLIRVLVDAADVMFRSGTPYYRNGNFDANDRLIVVRDRYGRPTYYRRVSRQFDHDRGHDGNRDVKCNKHGKCKVSYYDPRYDRDHDRDHDRDRDNRYYDRDDRHRWQARWRDRDRDDDDDERWDDDDRWDDD